MKYLIFILFLTGCASIAPQKLNPSVYYKNDICFTYQRDISKHGEAPTWYRNKIKRVPKVFKRDKIYQEIEICGSGVLPFDDSYNVRVNHSANMNFFAMNTCHREITTENPDRGFFKKDGQYFVDYKPTMESGKACPLFVATYNREGKHGWGVLAFEHPRFKMKSKMQCNGDELEFNGVSLCESKLGLLQKIEFPEEVVSAEPVNGSAERKEPCPKLSSSDNKTFEFIMPPRECIYGFVGKTSKQLHKLYTIGYEELIVRE
jgi:hypothetical protein